MKKCLKVTMDMFSDYNEYLSENGYETYFTFDDMDDLFSGMKPSEIIRMTVFGDVNYSDDYLKFNGYGNLESFSDYTIVKEMKADTDFIRWYIENNGLEDEYSI